MTCTRIMSWLGHSDEVAIPEEHEDGVPEGLYRLHRTHERDRVLGARKKAAVLTRGRAGGIGAMRLGLSRGREFSAQGDDGLSSPPSGGGASRHRRPGWAIGYSGICHQSALESSSPTSDQPSTRGNFCACISGTCACTAGAFTGSVWVGRASALDRTARGSGNAGIALCGQIQRSPARRGAFRAAT